jgi:hypothetical protein
MDEAVLKKWLMELGRERRRLEGNRQLQKPKNSMARANLQLQGERQAVEMEVAQSE